MDKKLKAKWIKALRSGQYKQDTGGLHDSRAGYCCLGVLADIKGCRWRGGKPFYDGALVSSDDAETGYLKPSFAGIRRSTQEQLAGMNDAHQSFDEIADYIKKRL